MVATFMQTSQYPKRVEIYKESENWFETTEMLVHHGPCFIWNGAAGV